MFVGELDRLENELLPKQLLVGFNSIYRVYRGDDCCCCTDSTILSQVNSVEPVRFS